MTRTRTGYGWVPFFLILLFYQHSTSSTTLGQKNSKTTTTPTTLNDANFIDSFTTTIHTGQMNNANQIPVLQTTSVPSIGQQSSTTQPPSKKTAQEIPTLNTQVFIIKPKGRIDPVRLPTTNSRERRIGSFAINTIRNATNDNVTDFSSTTERTNSDTIDSNTTTDNERVYNAEQLEYLTGYIKTKFGAEVDFAKLLTQYTNVCPTNEHCNFLAPNIQNFSSSFKNEFDCPYYCDCETQCVGRGNCCPGSIYAYTDHECINVRVLPENDELGFDMVAKCPSTFKDDVIVKKCETHTDQSNTRPVTSHDTFLTYKNPFCSICHGEVNVTEWKFTVKCPASQDFDDEFQSFADMKKQLLEQKCDIEYDLEQEDYKMKPLSCQMKTTARDGVNVIDRCNVTGLWFESDSDILWACEHFNGIRYLNYKNIFCFLCNPSIVSSNMPLIYDQCNITDNWSIYDNDLETACLTQPPIPRLFPFKNVYCIICNGVKTLSQYRRNMYKTNKIEVAILETLRNEQASTLTLDIDFIGENKVADLVEFVTEMYGDADVMNMNSTATLEKSIIPDEIIENQLKDYISICGSPWSCENSVGFIPPVKLDNHVCSGLKRCSCDEDCIERGNCCTELILRYRPYTCLNRSSILHYTANNLSRKNIVSGNDDDDTTCYSLVDKCRLISLEEVQLNITEDRKKMLSVLPVKHGKITYRNISYMMCNVKEFESIHIDIEVECSTYFQKSLVNGLEHFETLINLTKVYCKSTFISKSSKLDQQEDHSKWGYTRTIKPSEIPTLSNETYLYEIPKSLLDIVNPIRGRLNAADGEINETMFSVCNQTGLWSVNDENTRQICEDTEYLGTNLPEYRINNLVYRNYACYICNPEIDETVFAEEDIITSCNFTGLAKKDTMPLEEMERLCQQTEPQLRWLPFKNYYCSRCNLPHLLISQFDKRVFVHQSTNRHFDMTSYRTLFSLSMAEFSSMMNKEPIPDCVNGTFDYALKMCRPLFCRTGRVLQNNTCRPLIENGESLSYEIALKLHVETGEMSEKSLSNTTCISQTIGRTDRLDLVTVLEEFKKKVSENLVAKEETIQHSFTGCEIYSDIHCLHPTAGGDTIVYVNLLKEIRIQCNLYVFKTTNKSILESVLVDSLMDSYKISTVEGNAICLKATPKDDSAVYLDFVEGQKCIFFEPQQIFLISKEFSVDRFFTCVQIKLNEDEFVVNNRTGELVLENLKVNVEKEYFYVNGSEARMCLEDYVLLTSKSNSTGPEPIDHFLLAYNRFSEVCTILSMVCLFVTFITYCLFHTLRTLPGKNNMALCFGLFCAQGTLQFGIKVEDIDNFPLCIIMGVSIHYFWLATFFAMNICSFHMFRVFCSKALSVPSSSKRRFSKYLIYIFGMPLMIITVTLIAFLVSSNGTFSGYGNGRCFLTNIYGVICAFIIPSSIIFITNIIFFIVAFHKIRTSPRIQSSGDKREFFVYIKLCTVVGLTWPLQIVDAVLPLTLFSFFVVAVNASQGVFVCLSYVCNRRVFFLYKKCCSKDYSLTTASSMKTSSTDLRLTDRSMRNGI